MSILYADVDDEVYADLKSIAASAGLSITKTAEAIIAIAAGREHIFRTQVHRAVQTHRRLKGTRS